MNEEYSTISDEEKALPNVPNWNEDKKFNYSDTYLDTYQFDELNDSLIRVGRNLKILNDKLARAEKAKVKADMAYARKYRSELDSIEGETESKRRNKAQRACQHIELRVNYLDVMIKDMTRKSFELRTQLEILQTIGHNIRREMEL